VPEAPVATLLPQSDRGALQDDGVTNEPSPGFALDLDPVLAASDTIHAYIGGIDINQHTVTAGEAAGTDPITGLLGAEAPLADGVYSIQFSHENANGESALSTAIPYTKDTSLGTLTAAAGTGNVVNDTTPDVTVTISGSTLAADDAVELRLASDGTLMGSHVLTAGEVSGGSCVITLSEIFEETTTALIVSGYDDAGHLTEALAYTITHSYYLISDSFDGMTSGQDLNGRTPSPINVPGNNWVSAANGIESDGAGHVQGSANNETGAINTGITNNIMEASVDLVFGAATNECNLFILADAYAAPPSDMILLQLENTAVRLYQRVGGTFTELGNTTLTKDGTTTYNFRLRYDGADIRCYMDDVEIAALAEVGYSFPAGLNGNTFAGFYNGNPTSATLPLWDNFKATHPVAAPTVDLLVTSDRGASTTDNISNDPTPTFEITFPALVWASGTLRYYVGGVEIATRAITEAEVTAGSIEYTVAALADGTHSIQFSLETGFEEGPKSTAISYVLDTGLGTLAATVGTDFETTDTTPDVVIDISGTTLLENDLLEIRDSAATLLAGGAHSITAGEITAGEVTMTLTSALAAGSHALTISGYNASNEFTEALDIAVRVLELVIEDQFAAIGTANLAGWTPDTLNTPGGNWTDAGARWVGNGAGAVTHTVANASAQKDTGITNNVMRVEMEVNCGVSKTNLFIAICAASNFSGFGNEDGIYIQHETGSDTMKLFATTATQLASTTVARTIGVTHKYAIEYTGQHLKVFFDDVEVTALRKENYTIPAGQAGQSYIGLISATGTAGAVIDNVKVYA
jgi:hypothetical protein